jgi:hypothetical protein
MRAYLYVAYRIVWPVKYSARVSYLPLKLDKDGKPVMLFFEGWGNNVYENKWRIMSKITIEK